MVTGKQKLICVVGTTASGKSDFGVELAKKYGGEIVSADSRQVFRGLDLGSGKITPEEMQGVPHHLLDVRNPNEFFSMADFQAMAYEAIDDILRRGRLPLLVGGTGLYVDSVAEGYLLSGEAPDLAYRAHLETFETPALYQMLLQVMPDTDVDPKNRNRVMRLLERIHAGDDLTPRKEARYDVLKLGMTFPRPELCRRIDERLIRGWTRAWWKKSGACWTTALRRNSWTAWGWNIGMSTAMWRASSPGRKCWTNFPGPSSALPSGR